MTRQFAFILTLILLFISNLFAQNTEKVYRLESGKKLTAAQVDSLKKVYDDDLTYRYKKVGDQIVTIVVVPNQKTPKSSQKVKTSVSFSDQKAGVTTKMVSEIIYEDSLGNEITKKQFQEIIKDPDIKAFYSMEKVDGEQVVTMRPSNSPKGKKYMELMEQKKEKLTSWKGKPFPFEAMTDIEGNRYRPADLKGKIAVLNYWYVECGPCRKEMPELNALVDEYKNHEDILFLAPSLSDKTKIKKMLEERPFKYQLIPDAADLAIKLDVSSYPTNVVVDRSGTIVFLESGYSTDTVDELRDTIRDLANKGR